MAIALVHTKPNGIIAVGGYANINEVNDNEEYAVQNMLEAHEWLQKKFAAGQQKDYREARVDQLLDRELLPHLGDQGTDRKKKAVFPIFCEGHRVHIAIHVRTNAYQYPTYAGRVWSRLAARRPPS